MINGSAVANVATTGTITIPLMKQTGYKKEFAGAVEAVASTGGQFCPPIMGAVGFGVAGVYCGTATDECIRGLIVMWYWWRKKWYGKKIVENQMV